ncbi:hypothetical protein ACLH0B_21480 [Aeromonas salmonicida]|uniref:hypothetical protein n=1 Tax=Aeromonas salmonicida TaxID=645 RepID=UPI003D06B944
MQKVTTVSTLDGYKFKAVEAIKTTNVDASNGGSLITHTLALEYLEDKEIEWFSSHRGSSFQLLVDGHEETYLLQSVQGKCVQLKEWD